MSGGLLSYYYSYCYHYHRCESLVMTKSGKPCEDKGQMLAQTLAPFYLGCPKIPGGYQWATDKILEESAIMRGCCLHKLKYECRAVLLFYYAGNSSHHDGSSQRRVLQIKIFEQFSTAAKVDIGNITSVRFC